MASRAGGNSGGYECWDTVPYEREREFELGAFEAGALSKQVGDSRVIPFLVGLKPTDLTFPLAQFQAVRADKAGAHSLVRSINNAVESSERLDGARLDASFEKWWRDLEKRIKALPKFDAAEVGVGRTQDDMMNESLALLRELARAARQPRAESLGNSGARSARRRYEELQNRRREEEQIRRRNEVAHGLHTTSRRNVDVDTSGAGSRPTDLSAIDEVVDSQACETCGFAYPSNEPRCPNCGHWRTNN